MVKKILWISFFVFSLLTFSFILHDSTFLILFSSYFYILCLFFLFSRIIYRAGCIRLSLTNACLSFFYEVKSSYCNFFCILCWCLLLPLSYLFLSLLHILFSLSCCNSFLYVLFLFCTLKRMKLVCIYVYLFVFTILITHLYWIPDLMCCCLL